MGGGLSGFCRRGMRRSSRGLFLEFRFRGGVISGCGGRLCRRRQIGGQVVCTGGVFGGGVWRGSGVEAVVDVGDLLVEEGGQCVAEFLGWRDAIDVGAGVGEFFHDAEELFAVVCVVVQAVFEVGSFGLSDELVVLAGGVLVGCEAVRCAFEEPFLF
ncbi:hypothetical protein NDU88_000704 [Pleurodeles waltl]|uniref:Uncharacterized protein n=1 Tax=Pleurodeles waltl TaxID=8319 RepID=A0AAV7SX51_PLEWA|nr:hypothetical protein NDU88_000704 [Pleurodeles waltl]